MQRALSKKHQNKITENLIKVYEECFGIYFQRNQQLWIPGFICPCCRTSLIRWQAGNKSSLKFKTPTNWLEPNQDHSDCYFCLSELNGANSKTKNRVSYIIENCIVLPIPSEDISETNDTEQMDTAKPQKSFDVENSQSDMEVDEEVSDAESEINYKGFYQDPKKPILINQESLSDLIRLRT